jgi:hypothetical protein
MEIRGRMFSPLALPEYIRRLGTEKIFQGRSFAALTMDRPAEVPVARVANTTSTANAPNAANAAQAAQTTAPRYIEFVLTPKWGESRNERAERGERQ